MMSINQFSVEVFKVLAGCILAMSGYWMIQGQYLITRDEMNHTVNEKISENREVLNKQSIGIEEIKKDIGGIRVDLGKAVTKLEIIAERHVGAIGSQPNNNN